MTVAPRPPCSRGQEIAAQPPSWSLRCQARAIASQSESSPSDQPPTGDRWEAFGADLKGFLDVLGLDGVRAVGHSKGATAMAASAAAGTRRLARAVLIEPVLVSAPHVTEPAWDNPLAAGARKRRNVWPSREVMFASLRDRMPFETWEEEFVRLYVDHGVADRPDGQVELRCPGEIEAQVYAHAPMTAGF